MPKFTPTEQKLLHILADGRRHLRDELKIVLANGVELSTDQNLQMHMTRIRKKLQPVGQDIICELHSRRVHYRHVRLISQG